MKTPKLRLNGMVLTIFLSAITISAIAQQGYKNNRGNGNGQQTCQQIPNLSAEQESEITNLRTEHLKARNNYIADLHIMKAELNKLEIAENPNQKAIDTKIDEVFALKNVMAKQSSQHRQKIRSLLTSEQKVFFDSHSRKGRGHGNGRGQGNGYGNEYGFSQGFGNRHYSR